MTFIAIYLYALGGIAFAGAIVLLYPSVKDARPQQKMVLAGLWPLWMSLALLRSLLLRL